MLQVAHTRGRSCPSRLQPLANVSVATVRASFAMSRKKISTTIYVTPEQSERLRLLHERTKVPIAVYIREGIDLVLHGSTVNYCPVSCR